MMAFDPSAPPPWEVARGGGAVTRWQSDQEKYRRLRVLREQIVRRCDQRDELTGKGACARRQAARRELTAKIASMLAEGEALTPGFRKLVDDRALEDRAKPTPGGGIRQRRASGLCASCGEASEAFRCGLCAAARAAERLAGLKKQFGDEIATRRRKK